MQVNSGVRFRAQFSECLFIYIYKNIFRRIFASYIYKVLEVHCRTPFEKNIFLWPLDFYSLLQKSHKLNKFMADHNHPSLQRRICTWESLPLPPPSPRSSWGVMLNCLQLLFAMWDHVKAWSFRISCVQSRLFSCCLQGSWKVTKKSVTKKYLH